MTDATPLPRRLPAVLARAAAPVRRPHLFILLALAAALVGTVYQVGGDYAWAMGDDGTAVFLTGFFGVEHAGTVPFRWATTNAGLRAPGAGGYAGVAHLRLNGDPWGGPQRVSTVRINDDPPVAVPLEPGWHDYRVPFTAGAAWPGDVVIRLQEPELPIPPNQRDPKDTRKLGVPVESITVERMPGPVLPPLPLLGLTLAGVALLYAFAVWGGLGPGLAAGTAAGALGAWSLLLLGARLGAALAAPGLVLALGVAVGLALLLRAGLGALFRRGGVRIGRREGLVLSALFVTALTIKAAGLLDPVFVTLDQYARLHRLMEFGAAPLGFLQHFLDPVHGETYAGQLGLSAVVPYSPLFYFVFDPLNWLVADPDARLRALNLVAAALDASAVFFLYYAVKRAWGDGPAAVWAGALYVAFPLTNLAFSDGGYPGIFAGWLLVVFIAALAWAYPQRGRGAPAVLAVLLALALLAHTANALLLGTTLVLFAALVAIYDRARLRAVAVWGLAGPVLAFLSFYQFTTSQVITAVLPQLIGRLQSSGSVGQDAAKLGAPLLSGFWPQIQAHFRSWPVALGLVALATRARPRSAPAAAAPATARTGLALWLAASAGAVALFSLADLRVNLLQKHLIYAMPALALLNGLAFGALWRRGRAAQALCLVLWGALFFAMADGWVARVLWYVLPPGSG